MAVIATYCFCACYIHELKLSERKSWREDYVSDGENGKQQGCQSAGWISLC